MFGELSTLVIDLQLSTGILLFGLLAIWGKRGGLKKYTNLVFGGSGSVKRNSLHFILQ